jgi:SAM-dependent methyltransferase
VEISAHLRERNCPVCGSGDSSDVAWPARIDEQKLGDFAFASRKLPEYMHMRLVKCPICSVIYASPALTTDFLAKAYREASYDSSQEANYAARTYAGQLGRILSALGDREAALEVGAGNGAFLERLQDAGFHQVIGVEPSLEAAAAASETIRPLIRLGMFQASDFEPESISLFSCFQTIEHVENPRVLCTGAFRLLRPDGVIFLIGHDYESWVTALLGRKSPIFDIEHLQLFSKTSLRYLLESCGFQNVRIGTLRNCYPLAYWMKLLPLPAGWKRRLIPLAKALWIGRLPVSMNIGNLCAVGYKRGGRA